MAKDIDAVIAALRVLLEEAERRQDVRTWHISKVNDWIARLPGAWWGHWRGFKLRADYLSLGEANRESVITHLRTTLAYLESYREAPQPRRVRWWPSARRGKSAIKPSDTKIVPMRGNKLLH